MQRQKVKSPTVSHLWSAGWGSQNPGPRQTSDSPPAPREHTSHLIRLVLGSPAATAEAVPVATRGDVGCYWEAYSGGQRVPTENSLPVGPGRRRSAGDKAQAGTRPAGH